MKILAIISSILGIGVIGSFVWIFSLTGTLDDTRAELALTEEKLSASEAELAKTITELEKTNDELADISLELSETRGELESTEEELSSTKIELSNTKRQLSSSERKLSDTKEDLKDVEEQLEIAEDTLGGLGITLMRSKQCYDAKLVDNPEATDTTWAEVKAFLSKDKTENNRYIEGEYDCSEFSRDVHNNAEAAGIRIAEVHVRWSNDLTGHALNAFLTTDYGLVYIDCTGGPDVAVRVVKGKTYRGIEPIYITMKNIRNDLWWDSLEAFYYISTQRGDEAITSRIIIYW